MNKTFVIPSKISHYQSIYLNVKLTFSNMQEKANKVITIILFAKFHDYEVILYTPLAVYTFKFGWD